MPGELQLASLRKQIIEACQLTKHHNLNMGVESSGNVATGAPSEETCGIVSCFSLPACPEYQQHERTKNELARISESPKARKEQAGKLHWRMVRLVHQQESESLSHPGRHRDLRPTRVQEPKLQKGFGHLKPSR